MASDSARYAPTRAVAVTPGFVVSLIELCADHHSRDENQRECPDRERGLGGSLVVPRPHLEKIDVLVCDAFAAPNNRIGFERDDSKLPLLTVLEPNMHRVADDELR